jgi:O-antigen biosynthesis protein
MLFSFFSKRRDLNLIKKSALFDLDFYQKQVGFKFDDENKALHHFLNIGVNEGRNPHPLFDAKFYLAHNADVANSGINPLIHYIKYGAKDGRNPHPLFDTQFYFRHSPDVRAANLNPLAHYVRYGASENRNPHPLFDTQFYFGHSADVAAANLNPLVHYILHGASEGRDPNRFFHSLWYSKKYIANQKIKPNALEHYVTIGADKRFEPSIFFQTEWYAQNTPDIKKTGLKPFYHFMMIGEKDGRLPYADYVPSLDGTNLLARHYHCVVEMAGAEEKLEPASSSPDFMISFIVPVYNTPPSYLDDLFASFKKQVQNCELVLSDDGSSSQDTINWLKSHQSDARITVVWNAENKGIAAASNAGLVHAKGTWIGLVDHDDAITPFAASRIIKALEANPHCQFLYTDEILADGELRPVEYYFKPAWDIVLLSGVNYINHLSIYNRKRLLEIGGFRENFSGSQDYDLVLRYTANLRANEILHLPYPAYIWRRDGQSYSVKFLTTATQSARNALKERFGQENVDAAPPSDLHRVRFDLTRKDWPLVSVVIPSRDSFKLISCVLDGLFNKTDYPNMDVIIIDNGTTDVKVLELYEQYRKKSDSFYADVKVSDFNFSRSVNQGMKIAKGDYVLLLNNDIEMVNAGWLKEMVSCFDYENTGIVGAKLLYPDETLQHAGVIVGLGGLAGHWYSGRENHHPGKMGRLWVRQSMSAVTGACMLISKVCIEKIGVFDEEKFKVAYNDIDYSLRAVKAGFRVVWTPFAELVHHESISRGSDYTLENIKRFELEKDNLQDAHDTKEFEDRAYSPWYSKDSSEPAFMMLDELPKPR